jgi:hypothetical protein
MEVAPFDLVTRSGARVRVEPVLGKIDYCDALDGWNETADGRSTTATLERGEEIHVAGRLEGATESTGGPYRSGGGFVLRPPARGKMLVSSEPLGARNRRQARIHFVALGAAVLQLLIGVVVFAPPILQSQGCGDGWEMGLWIYAGIISWIVYGWFLFGDSERPWYDRRPPLIDGA